MRVICMNHDCFADDELPYGPDDPQIGDECIVIDACTGYGELYSEAPCYELEGYESHVYDQRNFATLPDNTADEMAEETKEAIVNLESVLA